MHTWEILQQLPDVVKFEIVHPWKDRVGGGVEFKRGGATAMGKCPRNLKRRVREGKGNES